MSSLSRFALMSMLVLGVACDRNVEPYVPGEPVEQPDLAKIFPEAAERTAEQGAPSMPAAAPEGGGPAAPAGPPIQGTLTVAPELSAAVPPGSTLFLIARNPGGGPPVAVKRIDRPRFPMDFELSGDDRMIQQIPFMGPLQLSARIDSDGNATTRTPGDLQGSAREPVEPGARGVAIVVDEVL